LDTNLGNLHCGQSPLSETVNQNGLGTPYISGPEQWDGFQIQMSKWTTARCLVAPANSIFITVKGAGVGKMFPGTTAAIGQDIYAFEPSIEMDYAFIYRALQYSIQDVIAKAHGDIPGLTKDHILSHGIMVPGPLLKERFHRESKSFSAPSTKLTRRSIACGVSESDNACSP
jgi:type I restriction enzyme, S subunit